MRAPIYHLSVATGLGRTLQKDGGLLDVREAEECVPNVYLGLAVWCDFFLSVYAHECAP